MAKVTRLEDHRPIEVRQAEWLRKYPDKFLACRMRHAWPDIIPGRRLKNTRMEPWHDPEEGRTGRYYLEQRCANCGRLRWKITGARGQYYAGSTRWQYIDPDGYATPPKLGIPRGSYMELYFTRLIDGDQEFNRALAEHDSEQKRAGR